MECLHGECRGIMSMRKLIVALIIATTVAVPAVAIARVPAHGSTRDAILRAAIGKDNRFNPYTCFAAYVASKGSPWAIVETPRPCRQVQAGGYTFVHQVNRRWRFVTSGDELCRENHPPGVSKRIFKRLAVCRNGVMATSVIAAAQDQRIKIPTGSGGVQYRPYVITVSADGSVYYGGRTGHQIVPRNLRDIGRLHWTQYTATDARATGVVWGLYGPGPLSIDTHFQLEGVVTLHAYRPRDGVFTRLAESGRAFTVTSSSGTRIPGFRFSGTSSASEFKVHGRTLWAW